MGVYPGCGKDIKLIIAGYMQVGFVMYSDTAIKYFIFTRHINAQSM